ncbi:MAG: CRISPR-associated helicase Cas3' [Candidatus Bathyarchaeia archaeon]
MSLLPRIYNDFLLSKDFFEDGERRPIIEHALGLLEDTSKEGGVLFLQLPTGYGKTTITFTSFFRAIVNPDFFWRVIHISPLRSIVEDIYRRIREGCEKALADINNAGDFEQLIGAQMMLLPGSPYLQKRLTITTFDTFSLSLAKTPVREISEIARGIGHGHFDVPRASILEALVVMDEIHTFLSETGESRALGVLTSTIRYLMEFRIPLVLMSATMPRVFVNKILESSPCSTHRKEIYYGDEGVVDKDWENEQINKKIETKLLQGNIDDIVKKSLELSSSYDRTLVVLNTIPRARQVYCELRKKWKYDKPLVLLHSKFKKEDREKKLKIVSKEKKWTLVSTQVVESGINISANALITDTAPANNLVQRAGRVARKSSDNEGIMVIIEETKEVERGFGIYNTEILKATHEELKKHVSDDKVKILWRNLDYNGYIGYQKFVNKVYSKGRWNFYPDPLYYRLISSFEWHPEDTIRALMELYHGSFLRGSPLIPLVADPSGELDYINYRAFMEKTIPIAVEDVGRMLRKGIKVEKIVRKEKRVEREEFEPRDLNKLVEKFISGRIIALQVNDPEITYTGDEGLMI